MTTSANLMALDIVRFSAAMNLILRPNVRAQLRPSIMRNLERSERSEQVHGYRLQRGVGAVLFQLLTAKPLNVLLPRVPDLVPYGFRAHPNVVTHL